MHTVPPAAEQCRHQQAQTNTDGHTQAFHGIGSHGGRHPLPKPAAYGFQNVAYACCPHE